MSVIPLSVLKDAAWEAGFADEDIWEFDYNGRYYARNCFGIVGGIGDYARFILEIERADHSREGYAEDLIGHTSTDNMAQDTIFYFPGIKPQEEAEDDE